MNARTLALVVLVGCGGDPAPSPPPTTTTTPPTPEPEAPARPGGPVPRFRIGTGGFYSPSAVRAIVADGDDVYVGRDGERIERWRRDGTRSMYFDVGPPTPEGAGTVGIGSVGPGLGAIQALSVRGSRVAAALGAHGAAVVDRSGEGDLFAVRDLGIVHDVALLPDGGLVTAHGGEAYANGHHVVDVTGDCGLCFWSPTGTRTATVAPADAGGWVTAVAATADGTVVVSGASDGRLRVYDGAGALVREIRAGDRRIEGVSITEPERTVLYANDVGGIFRVALDGSGRRALFGVDEIPSAFVLGASHLAWAGNGTIHVLGGDGSRVATSYLDGASALALDGDDILVGDFGGHVRRWSGTAWSAPADPSRRIDDVLWDASGEHLVVRAGTELRLFAASDGTLTAGPRALPDFVAGIALRAEDRLVVQRNAITLGEEDLVDGSHARGAGGGGGESVNHLAVSGDRAVFAYATYDRIRVGEETLRVEGGISAIALSDDGTEIAIATPGEPPHLEVRSVASGEVRWSVELAHVAPLLAWRGDAIGCAQGDALAEMRHASDGSVGPHHGETDSVTSAVAVSPGGRFLAFGAENGAVWVSDAAGGPSMASRTDHHGPITSLAFSPDGTEIASASADGTVLVWTVPTE